ncbi:cyclopropane-fatty-acyl-phospholipid synthase [Glaciecola punicea]|nr:cyclopropane-fatty-acyl-phospholipid synthase family protein [Glaciecola punicea]OFA30685.1 cyclopropane-fatty-acyl-phospholipid synthase [Glaciecola punicea]
MPQAQHTMQNTVSPSVWEKTCRSIFLSVLKRLPHGYMTMSENGQVIGQFGDKAHDLHAQVNILNASAYPKLLFGGSIASGETYSDNLWDSPNLTNVIRIFARNLPMLDEWESRFKWITMPALKLSHFANRNSADQAKRNISAHYDLGNKLYSKFLDRSMMYSAAIYPDPNASLADAQQHKLHTICEKLQLKKSDHLMEIGTGWGGLAIHAAKNYGCKVTTTTISEEQHAYAQQWINKEGLSDKITLLKQDYRLLEGEYDKLVSIEMIEAVGKRYLTTFFKKCSSLLKPDGLMLLQSIIIDDRRHASYSKSVDFIQKYIFPGGYLPSQMIINKHLKKDTDLSIADIQDIGLDYAQTLQDWFVAFSTQKEALAEDGYDERFMRMWQYYLNYCEGGFLERAISTLQLVMRKPQHRQVLSRG